MDNDEETPFQKTVYLDEKYTDINLIPAKNPFPKHTETLIHFTIHKDNDPQIILHNHVQLPLSLTPILDRTFLPSRTWHLENVYDKDINARNEMWVAIPMTFYHQCRVPEDFLSKVESCLEENVRGTPVAKASQCVIVDVPGKVPKHAFWIQVRGPFRHDGDVFDAARRQIHLLRQLVKGGYITLGLEVLGADRMGGYSPPSKHFRSL